MDGDDFIGEEDLRQIIKCLIGDHNLEDEMLSKLVDLVRSIEKLNDNVNFASNFCVPLFRL